MNDDKYLECIDALKEEYMLLDDSYYNKIMNPCMFRRWYNKITQIFAHKSKHKKTKIGRVTFSSMIKHANYRDNIFASWDKQNLDHDHRNFPRRFIK